MTESYCVACDKRRKLDVYGLCESCRQKPAIRARIIPIGDKEKLKWNIGDVLFVEIIIQYGNIDVVHVGELIRRNDNINQEEINMPKCKNCDYYDIEPDVFNFGLCPDCYRIILPDLQKVVTDFICGRLEC